MHSLLVTLFSKDIANSKPSNLKVILLEEEDRQVIFQVDRDIRLLMIKDPNIISNSFQVLVSKLEEATPKINKVNKMQEIYILFIIYRRKISISKYNNYNNLQKMHQHSLGIILELLEVMLMLNNSRHNYSKLANNHRKQQKFKWIINKGSNNMFQLLQVKIGPNIMKTIPINNI